MKQYFKAYSVQVVCVFVTFMYALVAKLPASLLATRNAAPTLAFAREHLGCVREAELRQVPSGTHDLFEPKPSNPTERQEIRREVFHVDSDDVKVLVMIQRLSPEKGTRHVFRLLEPRDKGGLDIPCVLALIGDGPSRKELELEAELRNLPVVFVGNKPHHELPCYYRAADCFITMSLTETYGLTCLEAYNCGCPLVVPRCAVFDEIWNNRVPAAWHYNIESLEELASAVVSASNGRSWLSGHMKRMTWADAAQELLSQYEECISANMYKRKWHQWLGRVLDQFLRTIAIFVFAVYVVSWYYRGGQRLLDMATSFLQAWSVRRSEVATYHQLS